MSIEAILAVMGDQRLKPTERYVLMYLAEYARKDGTNAFPLHKTLAERSGLNIVTVRSAIARGSKLGRVIKVGKHPVPGRSADRWPNNYTIVLDGSSVESTRGSSVESTRVPNGSSVQSERVIPTEHRGSSPQSSRSVNGSVHESSSSSSDDETISEAFDLIAEKRMVGANFRKRAPYKKKVLESVHEEHGSAALAIIADSPDITSMRLAELLEPDESAASPGCVELAGRLCRACGQPLDARSADGTCSTCWGDSPVERSR